MNFHLLTFCKQQLDKSNNNASSGLKLLIKLRLVNMSNYFEKYVIIHLEKL